MKRLLLVFAITTSSIVAGEQPETAAVLQLRNNGGLTDGEVSILTDRLDSEIQRSGKYKLVNRREIQEILKEQGFQQSGACSDEACAVELGQLLAVRKLFAGSVGKIGRMYSVTIKAYDVQTGVALKQVSRDLVTSKEKLVSRHLSEIVEDLVSDKSAQKEKTGSPKLKKAFMWGVPAALVAGGGVALAVLLGKKDNKESSQEELSEISVSPPSR